MAVNLTSGAIPKIVTGKCTSNDLLKPVLQVIHIASPLTRSKDNKRWYLVWFSDGSSSHFGCIADDIFISNKLQKGSIVQLTNFQLTMIITSNSKGEIINKSGIRVCDLNLLRTTCDIIGDPKLYHNNETPLVVRSTFTIPDKDQDHVDSLLNEDTNDSRHVEEPPTSIQNPSASTLKCSSTQNKKRKLQSSDDIISGFGKDISKLVSMGVEKTIEDGLGACYKNLGTLEEGVSRMTKLMMEKSKEVDSGFIKLETLKEDVSKMGKMVMEKSKEVDAGFKKMETLEEDVSKMAKMMMDKNKEDDVRTCFKKLETLEEDVSKMTRMMMEKNKEDVSKMKKMMIEKNKEDDVGACFKKLEALKEDVSEMSRMMMKIYKEDDMGACIEKLEKIGWGAQDPMYNTALMLFGQSADYRNLWLHLKPESCGNWVKNAGSMFGLLD